MVHGGNRYPEPWPLGRVPGIHTVDSHLRPHYWRPKEYPGADASQGISTLSRSLQPQGGETAPQPNSIPGSRICVFPLPSESCRQLKMSWVR